MIPQGLRKGQGLILIIVVFLFIVAISIHKYDLLPYEGYLNQYTPGTVLNQDPKGTAPIARKIWQIFSTPADAKEKPPNSIDPKALGDTRSWIGLNPGYQYQLLGAGTASADDFVTKHFSHDSSIIDTYFALKSPGLKTDLLRYLILWVEGGVYADLDTWAIKPIDDWVPEHLKAENKVRAIVGLEWDQLDGEPWPGFGDEPSYMTHVVQFCQWTLAAAPGHPLFENAIRTSVKRIADLADAKQVSIAELNPIGYVRVYLSNTDNIDSIECYDKNLTLSRRLSQPQGRRHGQMLYLRSYRRLILRSRA